MKFRVFDINETIRRVLIAREDQINEKGMDVEADFEREECLVEVIRIVAAGGH